MSTAHAGEAVRRLSLLAEINEDCLGTPRPRTDGLSGSKQALSSMTQVEANDAPARTPARDVAVGVQASPEGTDTSPQSSSSSAVSAAEGEVHYQVSEHI
jgi:hypothetical protein